ncbi:serine/threonine protein phosphatase PrpC [Parabacteroides sp. PFB2-10]|uniref:PP2C family protein-serine/threonine phosphatase n=1 Tax=Parabacteroides sp. PFB2-10 TaxID=1742405 RepID=UPI0024736AC0|nr:protein phosphatase 2C domain-containing protein [Parabacteroides sp. PFB2-10]MDH6311837.1 serine/threonine protein phosphatase PrpC [Parabacteroides sp. PFB2-10]MDL2245374.1 protein phosphatase 2C domain-containing protein [Parabacteroides sp. OttesenSCG-928-J18]
MNITIGKPCAISEKGGRLNNEDSLYPQPETVTSNQRLFIVCDGVGGADKGEVASALACESIQSYFSTFLEEGDPSKEFIQKAIQYTEARFEDYTEQHPEAKGMATTLTLLYIGSKGVTIAHVGDSRIYHFRDGQIMYQTEDHSLVNSLVRLGKITPQEATVHPQKNVILRAIQGTSRPAEVDVFLLQDIKEGDTFFMCTDGVLENLSDDRLSEIFKNHQATDAIKDSIVDYCNGRTRDNFSFYIIPVQHVHDNAGLKQNLLSLFYSFI